MSERFSNSPTLRLQIGKSRIAQALLMGFALAVPGALAQLLIAGHYALSILLLLPVLLRLWGLRVATREQFGLGLRAGQWYVQRAGRELPVRLERYSTLPWVICLVLRGAPGQQRLILWIFSDAADRETLRRLRVRLALSA